MLWAVELEATDQEPLALARIENLQRVNLSHAEKVAAMGQPAPRAARELVVAAGVDAKPELRR